MSPYGPELTSRDVRNLVADRGESRHEADTLNVVSLMLKLHCGNEKEAAN